KAALADLEQSLEALRVADSKHRLAFALLAACELETGYGQLERAQARAEEALRMADLLGRPSEVVLAHVALARIAAARGDEAEHRIRLEKLRARLSPLASHAARTAAEALLDDTRPAPAIRRENARASVSVVRH